MKASGRPMPLAPRGYRAVGAGQGDFQAAAQGDAVDEREGRHAQVGEQVVGGVAQGGHGGAVFRGGEVLDPGEVRAGDQEVRLAGHGQRVDFPGRGARLLFGEHSVQFDQGIGAERGRLGVVQPVVQGHQRQSFAAGQDDVGDQCVGDEFVRERRGEGREVFDGALAHG